MSMQTHIVLNVDDKGANRYVKSRVLRAAGFRVIEADNGRAALELTAERQPDIVLLDLKLPDISGFEVCRILKSDPKTSRIPVVHISATFTGEEIKRDSAQAGAEVYLAEPVAPEELTSAVRTVLRLRATERVLAESEARLRLASEGAGIASWDLAANPPSATWSKRFYELLGLDPATPASLEAWLGRVPPGERPALATALADALERSGSIALEHWIERADTGEARCVAVFGSLQGREGAHAGRLIGVALDVTSRKRVEAERERLLEQARAAQQAAEDAARMKDEFLAILSHELRTPMAAVLGWLHLLRSGALAPEQQAKALAVVERNSQLQVQLVNDLLDVSSIITGKFELRDETVSLDQVLRNAADSARPGAEARGLFLRFEIAPGRWLVRGSASRLAQVFGNLLSNAVKFSPPGGVIELRAYQEGERAIVIVSDQGEGIAPQLLAHVFETFRQADSSTRRRHGGLGLGLAIVKSIVELHGGEVRAESAGAGKGATFRVVLPVLDGLAAGAPAQGTVAMPLDALQDLHILVVEDDADHRDLLEQVLQANGACVRCASASPQALQIAQAWRPEVLVLDIGMPSVDGYELLGLIRQALDATGESLPALALTGFAAPSDVERALARGFQAHVAKPFKPQELIATLARLAQRR